MALLEQPNATMNDVLRVLTERSFRQEIAHTLKNETVRTFLLKEFDRFSFGYRTDGTAPIQNKVGAFLSDPLLNRLLRSAPVVETSTCSGEAIIDFDPEVSDATLNFRVIR
jgi:hypothetical protein